MVSAESRRLGYGDRLQVAACSTCGHLMTRLVDPLADLREAGGAR